jgi:hypothetical protein
MSKKGRLYLAAAAGSLMAALAWTLLHALAPPAEPVYHGKPLSYWLQGIGSRSDAEPTESEAIAAMRQAGTNAIPTLLWMLRVHDSPLKTKLLAFASKQHFIKIQHTNPYTLNEEAFLGFQTLGPNAVIAVPELIKILEQNVSLSSENFTARSLAVIGPPARAAVPVLLRIATDPNVSDHSDALWALGLIHDDPHEVVPVLIRALDSPSEPDKLFAAISIGRFHDDVGPAVPALVRILRSSQSARIVRSGRSTLLINPQGLDLRRHVEQDLKQIAPEIYALVVTNSVLPDSAGLGFFNQTNSPF